MSVQRCPQRPTVSEKNHKRVFKIANLPIDVIFDQALTVVLDKIEKPRGK